MTFGESVFTWECPEWVSGNWVSQANLAVYADGATQFPDKKICPGFSEHDLPRASTTNELALVRCIFPLVLRVDLPIATFGTHPRFIFWLEHKLGACKFFEANHRRRELI